MIALESSYQSHGTKSKVSLRGHRLVRSKPTETPFVAMFTDAVATSTHSAASTAMTWLSNLARIDSGAAWLRPSA